jgi:hypothetical protein
MSGSSDADARQQTFITPMLADAGPFTHLRW